MWRIKHDSGSAAVSGSHRSTMELTNTASSDYVEPILEVENKNKARQIFYTTHYLKYGIVTVKYT